MLSEGDTLLAHRTGIPVQAWWTSPFAHVNFGSGVGPYLAYDGARTENQIGQISPLGLVWLLYAYYSVHIVLICLEK